MVKVQNLKKHMERFNKVVNGLKEGKQEMAKQVQELAASIDALFAKIKVSSCQQFLQCFQHKTIGCTWNILLFYFMCTVYTGKIFQSTYLALSMTASDLYGSTPVAPWQKQFTPVVLYALS